MRYYVTLDPDPQSRPVTIDLVELPSGALEASIEGRPVDVGRLTDARFWDVADPYLYNVYTLLSVNGQVVDLTTEGAPPELGAVASGHRSYVRVESERMRAAALAKKSSATGGDKVVKSPMPGRVVKVLVERGDTVTAGQGLFVLEAMKMENEVRARVAGTVAEVHVTAGATVEGSAKLLTFA